MNGREVTVLALGALATLALFIAATTGSDDEIRAKRIRLGPEERSIVLEERHGMLFLSGEAGHWEARLGADGLQLRGEESICTVSEYGIEVTMHGLRIVVGESREKEGPYGRGKGFAIYRPAESGLDPIFEVAETYDKGMGLTMTDMQGKSFAVTVMRERSFANIYLGGGDSSAVIKVGEEGGELRVVRSGSEEVNNASLVSDKEGPRLELSSGLEGEDVAKRSVGIADK